MAEEALSDNYQMLEELGSQSLLHSNLTSEAAADIHNLKAEVLGRSTRQSTGLRERLLQSKT